MKIKTPIPLLACHNKLLIFFVYSILIFSCTFLIQCAGKLPKVDFENNPDTTVIKDTIQVLVEPDQDPVPVLEETWTKDSLLFSLLMQNTLLYSWLSDQLIAQEKKDSLFLYHQEIIKHALNLNLPHSLDSLWDSIHVVQSNPEICNLPPEKRSKKTEAINWYQCTKDQIIEEKARFMVWEKMVGEMLHPGTLFALLVEYAKAMQKLDDKHKAAQLYQIIMDYQKELDWSTKHANEQFEMLQFLLDSLDENTKTAVIALQASYSSGAPYPKISEEALLVLSKVKMPELRKEIKKMVSLSFERDKKYVDESLAKIEKNLTLHNDKIQASTLVRELKTQYNYLGEKIFLDFQKRTGLETSESNFVGNNHDSLFQLADSLHELGKYLKVGRIMLPLIDSDYGIQAQQKREKAGNEYCQNQRRKAANNVKNYKKSNNKSSQKKLLLQAKTDLNSCLEHFPEIPISKTVKKNQTLIQSLLEKLENQN